MAEGDQASARRILFVDDSKLVRVSAANMLADEFSLTFAEDGEQAWQQLMADEAIRMVFTDLTMPTLDGAGLLQRIRVANAERLQTLPVVLVTADETEAQRERAYNQGATDFINKPFDAVALRARARAHVHAQVRQAQLTETAAIDPETALFNRHSFLERLHKDRAAASRHGLELTLLQLDILGVHDLYLSSGRGAAHRLLKEVGDIIRRAIRLEDTAARVGVSKFALSLPLTPLSGGQQLGERLRQQIAETSFEVGSESVTIVPRLGVVQVPWQRNRSPEDLLKELGRASSEDVARMDGAG